MLQDLQKSKLISNSFIMLILLIFSGCAAMGIGGNNANSYEKYMSDPDMASLPSSDDAKFNTVISSLDSVYFSVAKEVKAYNSSVKDHQEYVQYTLAVNSKITGDVETDEAVSMVIEEKKNDQSGFGGINEGTQSVLSLDAAKRMKSLATNATGLAKIAPQLASLAAGSMKFDLSMVKKGSIAKSAKDRLAYAQGAVSFLQNQYKIALATKKMKI